MKYPFRLFVSLFSGTLLGVCQPFQTSGAREPIQVETKALWYNIEYAKFDENTQVTSYTRRDPMTTRQLIERTNTAMMKPAVTGAVNDSHSATHRTLSHGQSLAQGPTLPESPFDLDTTIAAGQTVEFVLGNNGSGCSLADESLLRAVIAH